MLDELTCGSWLVYATRSTAPDAKRVRTIIVDIKRDRLDSNGRLYADVVAERLAARIAPPLSNILGNVVSLIPVPRASLTRPNTVWPALSLCHALYRAGLGATVSPVLRRAHAVHKSAGRQIRPTLREHYESLAVQGTLDRPQRIVLVDDVVTAGTTLMAGALRLSDAFPRASIQAFALARVLSEGDPALIAQPMLERITVSGEKCRRDPF